MANIFDDEEFDGNDAHIDALKDTVRLLSDALSELIESGIVNPENLENYNEVVETLAENQEVI